MRTSLIPDSVAFRSRDPPPALAGSARSKVTVPLL
jgi:hypothetical protein